MSAVRTAASGDVDAVVHVITLAFAVDPITRWAIPDPHAYLSAMPDFVRAFGGYAFPNDTADWTADRCGAALWLPPGVEPDGERMMALLETYGNREALSELRSIFEQMGRFHPTKPHWYLPLIGVDPACQGRGLGGALMRYATDRCDRDGLPAYLESSNPRNISLYQRHGFEVMGRIQAGSSPIMTPMYRQPR
jgi:ribosomal protein S18 acetylase RimI-like enzyme